MKPNPLLGCLALLTALLLPVDGSAQVRRSAAERGAPPPTYHELVRLVPASSTVAGGFDADAALDVLSGALGPLMPPQTFRALVEAVLAPEIPDDIPVTPSTVRSVAFGATSADRSVVLVLDDAVVREGHELEDGVMVRRGASTGYVRSGRAVLVGEGVSLDRATQVDAHGFDLAERWPAAGEAVGADPIGWIYVADAEVLRGIDRELQGLVGRAAIHRLALAVERDGRLVGVFDTRGPEDVSVAFGRVRATVDAAVRRSSVPEGTGPYVAALIERAWQHLSIRSLEDGSTVVQLDAPECGGVVQQLTVAAVVAGFYVEAEDEGLGVDGEWSPAAPSGPVACSLTRSTPATLAWHGLAGLEPEGFEAAALLDLGALLAAYGPTAGGAFPFALDADALRSVLGTETGGALLDGSGQVGAVWADAPDPLFAFGPVELAPDDGSMEVAQVDGLGAVWPAAAASLAAPGRDLPDFVTRFRDAVPGGSTIAILISDGTLDELAEEVPALARGAATTALRVAEGAVLVFAEDGPSLRLVGVPHEQAERVQTHLRASIRDAGALLGLGRGLSRATSELASSVELLSVLPYGENGSGGIELRLAGVSAPATVLVVAAFGVGAAVSAFAVDGAAPESAAPP